MSRLPLLTYRQVVRRLRNAGFVFDRQAKGSHEIWYNPNTRLRVTVPNHPGARYAASNYSPVRLSVDEFIGDG